MPRHKSTDLDEVVRVFARHGVEYVLIGGQAAVIAGAPIVTFDADVCYSRREDNLRRLVLALSDLHARLRVGGMTDEEAEDLPFSLDSESIARGMNFTFQTRAGALDVLGMPSGVAGYDELVANASSIRLADEEVLVASIRDLISMKRAAGRKKDVLALPTLLALQDRLEERGEA